MKYKEFKQYVDKNNKNIADKLKDNEEELAFYTNLVVRFNDICEENEELKSQLKEQQKPQIFIDTQNMEEKWGEELYQDYLEEQVKKLKQECNDTYVTSKEINFELSKENQKLKKQLHEASLHIQELYEQDVECPSNCSKLKDLLKQQQEFIKYLENEINKITGIDETKISQCLIPIIRCMKNTYKEILQKYKEITDEMKDKSRKWLKENNFSEIIF